MQARGTPFLTPGPLMITAMAVSDLALEALFGWGMHALIPVVYACIAGAAGIGLALRRRRHAAPVFAAALGASVAFFFVTNFAVWATTSHYAASIEGLAHCYVAAIPFFRSTAPSTLLYSAALFGGCELLARRSRAARLAGSET